jgi:hypothetical protein
MESLQALTHQAGLALKKPSTLPRCERPSPRSSACRQPISSRLMQSLLAAVAKYGLARGSALLLLDRKTNTLASVVHYGLSERYLAKGPVLAGHSMGEVTTGRPVVYPRSPATPGSSTRKPPPRSMLLFWGCLSKSETRSPAPCGSTTLRVRARTGLPHVDGALAHQVGIALEKTS